MKLRMELATIACFFTLLAHADGQSEIKTCPSLDARSTKRAVEALRTYEFSAQTDQGMWCLARAIDVVRTEPPSEEADRVLLNYLTFMKPESTIAMRSGAFTREHQPSLYPAMGALVAHGDGALSPLLAALLKADGESLSYRLILATLVHIQKSKEATVAFLNARAGESGSVDGLVYQKAAGVIAATPQSSFY